MAEIAAIEMCSLDAEKRMGFWVAWSKWQQLVSKVRSSERSDLKRSLATASCVARTRLDGQPTEGLFVHLLCASEN